MPSIDFSIALIAVAPFLAALLAPLVFRFAGAMAGWALAIVPASIFVFLTGFVGPVAEGQAVAAGFDWIPAYGVRFSFFIDGLSLVFALLIAGIGTIVTVYSGAYLAGHVHQGRLLAFFLAFMGAMLGLVLADDLVTLFVFWELTSVTSFLLIGFDHKRQAARRAAIQSLVITSGGGLALLAGLILMQYMAGSWALSEIRLVGEELRATGFYLPVLLLVLAGAFTKSAQVPFHFWLPSAMEAPTPVSAFLHSATMVNAGVYLLARMFPVLGGSFEWSLLLGVFGGTTLIWGALAAIRQTDLKLMLAQTTVASLGLLVLLIGVGTDAAIVAAVIYLVAHALYKAGLFLTVGTIAHGTGTRDVTALGGLLRAMPLTFAGVALAALSMAGVWPALGFLAKEEGYAALAGLDWRDLVVLAVLVAGNALMVAVALAVTLPPFLGPRRPTPIVPREGSVGLVLGPLLLGAAGIAAMLAADRLGAAFVAPAASTIADAPVDHALGLMPHFGEPALYLTVLTWALGGLVFWRMEMLLTLLRRAEGRVGWSFDLGFDQAMFGLIRFADRFTRLWHHGRLDLYMVVAFAGLAAALYAPLIVTGEVPPIPALHSLPEIRFYEWSIVLVALIGLGALLLARTRLIAIVTLGVQGFAVALIFLLFGAPDLAFTQFMVETLAVVILALVMTRLAVEGREHRELEASVRDGGIALVCGLGVTMLMWAVLQHPLDQRLPEFFAATSVPVAHGHNIVNVILVDYRGIDTLGEIAVVMTAGIGILALIRLRAGGGGGAAGRPLAPPRGRTRRALMGGSDARETGR